MKYLQSLYDSIIDIIQHECGSVVNLSVEDKFQKFSYPKLLSIMKFNTEFYEIFGIGRMFTMMTKSPFMNLMTISITPFNHVMMPYTLIDVMKTQTKFVLFIEYYNCTEMNFVNHSFTGIKRYADNLHRNYAEKPAWYNKCVREDYSIIKESDDFNKVNTIIQMSVECLCRSVFTSEHFDNSSKLLELRSRMISEGTPATSTLLKVFSREDIVRLYSNYILPITKKGFIAL